MQQTRFLAVACFEEKITHAQAWQIAQEGEKYISMSIDPPYCGQIAVELGMLTPDTVDLILRRLELYRQEGRVLDDPLGHRPPARIFTNRTVWASIVAGGAILLLLAVVWFFSKHDWGAVALVASAVVALWLALSSIVPDLYGGYFVPHRVVSWVSMVLGPLTWGYCIYTVYELFRAGALSPVELNHLWQRFISSMLLLGGCFIVFLALSNWRHREIWYLEARTDLMRGLVSKTYAAISHLKSTGVKADRQHALPEMREVLQETVRILTLNPWVKFLRQLVFGFGPIGTVSLWYLEPETKGAASFDRFKILLVVAPGAPQEVLSAFNKIRQSFRPVRLREERLLQATENSTRGGKFDPHAFMKIPDRNDFVSVVGYVFARKQGIDSGNALEDIYFDHSYVSVLKTSQFSYTVRRWLDFNSFAAYPVMTTNAQSEPVGVLIAFTNLRNGITPEDKHALVAASRLIGLILSETEHETER